MEICDNGTLTNWGSRDINCAADVDRMAKMGKFPVEFDVYGCAYWENGEAYFRVSSDEEQLYAYIQNSVYEGRYPTCIEHYMRSEIVLSDQYEQIMEETKYILARKMNKQYKGLFDVLQPLAETKPNNNSFPFLRSMAEIIDGTFDDTELQLLEGAIQFAFQAKILTLEGYQQMITWVMKRRQQMIDDPVVQDNFGRTFYGFGFETEDGAIQYYCDAKKITVYEKQQLLMKQGHLTMPIYARSYWFKNRNQLNSIKKEFRSELARNQDYAYLQFLKQLKSLPGVIPTVALNNAILWADKYGTKEAAEVFQYYKCQWNVDEN